MVLGILTAIAACPAIIGTTEAVRQGQRQNARERHRGLKSNLFVSCFTDTQIGKDVNGSAVVLRNGKVPTLIVLKHSSFLILTCVNSALRLDPRARSSYEP